MSVICLENTSAQLHPNVQLNTNKKRRAANAQQKQAVEQGWYIRQVGYRQRDEIQYWQQVTWNSNKRHRGTLRNTKLGNKSRSAVVGGKGFFQLYKIDRIESLLYFQRILSVLPNELFWYRTLCVQPQKPGSWKGALSLSKSKWQNCTSLGIFDSFLGNEPPCGQMVMMVK